MSDPDPQDLPPDPTDWDLDERDAYMDEHGEDTDPAPVEVVVEEDE